MHWGDTMLTLKGSFPTPGARPTQSSSSELYHQHSLLGSAADKKRSRLGYHRTTVACGRFELEKPFLCTMLKYPSR